MSNTAKQSKLDGAPWWHPPGNKTRIWRLGRVNKLTVFDEDGAIVAELKGCQVKTAWAVDLAEFIARAPDMSREIDRLIVERDQLKGWLVAMGYERGTLLAPPHRENSEP